MASASARDAVKQFVTYFYRHIREKNGARATRRDATRRDATREVLRARAIERAARARRRRRDGAVAEEARGARCAR
jgi:hypothetical protein